MTAPTDFFEATLQAMRETREQMRALRKEYEREVLHEAVTDKLAMFDAPPRPEVRKRLKRTWAWWKRMR